MLNVTTSGAEIPWTAIVGIAGIAGTVIVAYLTNRAAERRMRLQQEYDDGRRFHNDRVELYGKLLAASQQCRAAAAAIFRNPDEYRMRVVVNGEGEANRPLREAVSELSATARKAQLLAGSKAREAAETVITAAAILAVPAWTSEEEFDAQNQELAAAEEAFMEAARLELLATGRA